ncbi:MAG: Stp1/IreP family PP2C-type Ser/Thr phosphatase [Acidobacteria bacterium]|nr:Stp1/IreP family PP2C-type Ser/Thr phosphatase [Acidobacteriota bacterium]
MKRTRTTQAAAAPAASPSELRVSSSVLTDPGCVRETNEDSARVFNPNDPALVADKGVLAVVADGMGGHAAGEVASRIAVETVGRVYYAEPGGAREALTRAFAAANAEIFAAARADEELRGMGTTCTALALVGGAAHAAHVGDSRLYLLRGGEIYQLTEDHSAVMELVKRGVITPEEARRHEDKNVILRALGTTPSVEVEAWDEPLAARDGDTFLLCSDGLCDLVGDEELRDLTLASADTHEACEKLVARARERGGHDNITVAVIALASAAEFGAARAPRETRELEVGG